MGIFSILFIFIIVYGACTIAKHYFRHKQTQEYYQFIRSTLDKGQPIPENMAPPPGAPLAADPFAAAFGKGQPSAGIPPLPNFPGWCRDMRRGQSRRRRTDVRAGILLLALSLGFFIWLVNAKVPDLDPSIVAIPVCLGVALLINAALTPRDEKNPPDPNDPASRL